MESINILGVKISRVNYRSAIGTIEGFLATGRKYQVVTPNPEFVVLAQKDPEFRRILDRAALAVPDGVGLRMAAKFLSLPVCSLTVIKFFQLLFQGLLVGAAAIFRPSFLDVLPETVTGTDLMLRLCERAARKGYTVFLLGGRGGVAERAAERLKEQFANLNIAGTYEGNPQEVPFTLRPAPSSTPRRNPSGSRGRRDAVLPRESRSDFCGAPYVPANANDSNFGNQSPFASTNVSSGAGLRINKVDLLFVAYGAPKQEKWIACNLPKIPVKVAMGVGGAFDFIAGKRKRAPEFLRRLGLEWLWRLLQEPQRLPRIFNATIRFPLLVFLHKLRSSPPSQSTD